MHFVPENGTYAWFRYDADSTVMVVINKNATRDAHWNLARFEEVLKTPATRGTCRGAVRSCWMHGRAAVALGQDLRGASDRLR